MRGTEGEEEGQGTCVDHERRKAGLRILVNEERVFRGRRNEWVGEGRRG